MLQVTRDFYDKKNVFGAPTEKVNGGRGSGGGVIGLIVYVLEDKTRWDVSIVYKNNF